MLLLNKDLKPEMEMYKGLCLGLTDSKTSLDQNKNNRSQWKSMTEQNMCVLIWLL